MYSNHYNYNLLLLIRDFLFFIQKINKYRAGERKNIGLWGMYTHQQFHCGLFGGDVVQRSGTWLVVNYVRVVVERSLLYCTPATYASCSKPSHFHSWLSAAIRCSHDRHSNFLYSSKIMTLFARNHDHLLDVNH